MSEQLRIPRVVITPFFHSLSKAILKTAELPSLVWCRSFYFSAICSSFRHVRVRAYIYNIVQSSKYKTARPVVRILLNSLDFWSSKTITSILLLSEVLLKVIHAMTFRTKFLLFVSLSVPPNNPITACGATSFPGYHSFPKWAMVNSRCYGSCYVKKNYTTVRSP